jgi:hypothetical protein
LGVECKGGEHGRAYLGDGLLERDVESAAGGESVTTTPELLSDSGHVVRAAAAKAEFYGAALKFNGNKGGFGTGNSEAFIDESFGIGSDGTGLLKVFGGRLNPDKPSVGFRSRPAEDSTGKSESGEGILFVDEAVEFVWDGALFEEVGGDLQSLRGGGGEAEPAGIGGDGGIEVAGGCGVEGDVEGLGKVMNEFACGSGFDIAKDKGIELIAAHVMINHNAGGRGFADHVRHAAQLLPGAGVDDEDDVRVGDFGACRGIFEYADAVVGIHEQQVCGRGGGVPDGRGFSEFVEDMAETEF